MSTSFYSPFSAPQLVGVIADRFEILRTLGVGNMGAVYLAKDHSRNECVALKVLHRHLASQKTHVDRFHRECRSMKKIASPHVVAFVENGDQGNFHFIAMEFVEGASLEELLTGEPFTVERTVQVMRDLASALVAVHNAGIIHHDVKPENILISLKGTVKLIDFGIACSAGATTRTSNALYGSVHYLAPEVWRRCTSSPAIDLYSLGCIGYRMITGSLPFPTQATEELYQAHRFKKPLNPQTLNAAIPDWLDGMIMRLLSKKPSKRFRTATEVSNLLDQMQYHEPRKRPSLLNRFMQRSKK